MMKKPMQTVPSKVTQSQKYRIMCAAFAIFVVALAACGQAAAGPTATPAPTLVPSSTASPTEDIKVSVEGTLTAMAAAPLGPTATDITLTPEITAEATETPISVTLPALAGEKIDPPLTISLPADWKI